MNAFLYGIFIHWKQDIRNRNVFLTYYVIPIIFFGFMGVIFTSINPEAKDTLIQSMTVFAITMGTLLGAPTSLIELYSDDITKAFKVGGIPLWMPVVNNFISGFIHLSVVSLIIFMSAPIIFDAKVPSHIFVYFVVMSLFLIVSLFIGSLLGLYIKSVSKLTMFSQLIFLPSLMLSGIMFPTSMLPNVLEKVGIAFPAKWGFEMMVTCQFDYLGLSVILSLSVLSFILIKMKLNTIAQV
ncbi:MAG: ABC transporter permease [Clostridiales bacterium]|nr:ABC transporter permease [Clostridiales bacterium]